MSLGPSCGNRNGYYVRKLETSLGQVELSIPRDREGRYYPSPLQPYARRQVDVGEVAVALYAAGVSQRKSAEVMSLLLGHRYSHETVSALTDQVLEKVSAFRQRPLPVALPETLLSPRSGVAYFRGSERGVGQTHL